MKFNKPQKSDKTVWDEWVQEQLRQGKRVTPPSQFISSPKKVKLSVQRVHSHRVLWPQDAIGNSLYNNKELQKNKLTYFTHLHKLGEIQHWHETGECFGFGIDQNEP